MTEPTEIPIHRFKMGTPEQQFFSDQLVSFIQSAQTHGLTIGGATSCLTNMAAYLVAAYVADQHGYLVIDGLKKVLQEKYLQALTEAEIDRAAGRLPSWNASNASQT